MWHFCAVNDLTVDRRRGPKSLERSSCKMSIHAKGCRLFSATPFRGVGYTTFLMASLCTVYLLIEFPLLWRFANISIVAFRRIAFGIRRDPRPHDCNRSRSMAGLRYACCTGFVGSRYISASMGRTRLVSIYYGMTILMFSTDHTALFMPPDRRLLIDIYNAKRT